MDAVTWEDYIEHDRKSLRQMLAKFMRYSQEESVTAAADWLRRKMLSEPGLAESLAALSDTERGSDGYL